MTGAQRGDFRRRRRQHQVWVLIGAFALLVSAWGLVSNTGWWQVAHAVLIVVWLVIIYREALGIRRTHL